MHERAFQEPRISRRDLGAKEHCVCGQASSINTCAPARSEGWPVRVFQLQSTLVLDYRYITGITRDIS